MFRDQKLLVQCQEWLKDDYKIEQEFTLFNVLFGVHNDRPKENVIINQIMYYCKVYIHKCKWKDTSPNIIGFKNYFSRYGM